MDGKCKQEYYDDGSPSNLSQYTRFFKIVVNPQDDKLRIPTGFIQKYRGNLPHKVYLKASNGIVRQLELVQLDGKTWLCNGWKEFRDYYSICVGHVLVFEYDGKSHFNVYIFDMTTVEIEYPLDDADEDEGDLGPAKAGENGSESDDSCVILEEIHTTLNRKRERSYGQCSRGIKEQASKKKMTTIADKEKCAAYRRAKAFESNNPFCICLMQPSYVTYPAILFIPVHFARQNLPKQENKLTLHVKAKGTWSVKCSLFPGKASMTGGWLNFVNDNGLKVGDVCVFEVNKRDKLLWSVTIFRGPETVVEESEDSTMILKDSCTSLKGKGKVNGKGERLKMERIKNKERCRTYKMAKAHVFNNPICIIIMQPSYVTVPFCLNIPTSFAREHLPATHNKLKLRVQDATWNGTCVIWGSSAKINAGWTKFVKDNALKVGDTCVFEVNKHKKLLWNVTIFRS